MRVNRKWYDLLSEIADFFRITRFLFVFSRDLINSQLIDTADIINDCMLLFKNMNVIVCIFNNCGKILTRRLYLTGFLDRNFLRQPHVVAVFNGHVTERSEVVEADIPFCNFCMISVSDF